MNVNIRISFNIWYNSNIAFLIGIVILLS